MLVIIRIFDQPHDTSGTRMLFRGDDAPLKAISYLENKYGIPPLKKITEWLLE